MGTLEIIAAIGRAAPSVFDAASDLFALLKRAASGEAVTFDELKAAEDAQLERKITTKAEALEWARRWSEENPFAGKEKI